MPRNVDRTPRPPRAPRMDFPAMPGTHETRSGGIVHTDEFGRTTRPRESRITDEHISESGKSVVIDHRDGVRESVDVRTGQDRVSRIPARFPTHEVDTRYLAPSSAERRTYTRNSINITINERNSYLRERNYVRQEPIFYSGYRWQPPVFAPILYATAALIALDEVYTPAMPRDSVFSMTGVNGYYADGLAQLGVNTSYDLVYRGRSPGDRELLSEDSGVPIAEIRKAVGQADLMRVYGIGPLNSRLLVDAGLTSVQDLARYSWDPESLYEQLKYSSFWDGQRAPSRNQVAEWIGQARQMPVAIYD